MHKILYAQNRRSGGAYIRRFLQMEYKDRCFIGFPKSQKDIDFILSDQCICYSSQIQMNDCYSSKIKQIHRSLIKEFKANSKYSLTIIRHPVKRLYSGIQRQVELLNNPVNSNNFGRFSFLGKIYGPYTSDFAHRNINPAEFNNISINMILRYLLFECSDSVIEENDYTMWLYEGLHTTTLGDSSIMNDCLKEKKDIVKSSLSELGNQLGTSISTNFNFVGCQENSECTLSRLVNDGILSKETVEKYREIFPLINTTKPLKEEISPNLLQEWFQKFPYDFAIWSWAAKRADKNMDVVE